MPPAADHAGQADSGRAASATVTQPILGTPVRRLEDPRLVTGHGSYTSDMNLPGTVDMALRRASVPQARVLSIDLQEARAAPGVVGAWALADLNLARLELPEPPHPQARPFPVLADGRVHYEGEALAAVAAETAYQAADAAELVQVELEPEPAELVEVGRVEHGFGDAEAAVSVAPVVLRERLRLGKAMGAAMEPRACLATYEPKTEVFTVWATTAWTFGLRDALAAVLGVAGDQVVVRAPDVGGSFGAKNLVYPEYAVAAALARELRRPVRWVASRSEDGHSTGQTHGADLELELGADEDGRLLGIRGLIRQDLGAYLSRGINQSDNYASHVVAAYHLPALHLEVEQRHSPAPPSIHIRGGGRPVGNFAIERMLDRLARRLRLEPAEVRRRNLIQPDEMPYDTGYPLPGRPGSVVYDGGDYPRLLAMALERAGRDDVRRRQSTGAPVGIGLAMCVESTGIGGAETARVRVLPDGMAEVIVGVSSQGQGHQTMLSMVAAERLGWEMDQVRVLAGDTRLLAFSNVTAGSRTAVEAGNAVALAAATARRRLLERAAEALEADPVDIDLRPAGAHVRGVPGRVVPLATLVGEALVVSETFDPRQTKAHASSCHAAVVQIDLDTGAAEVLRYVIAHDSGRTINPLTLNGQLHGGYAHGLGYALFEEANYGADGTFLSPSFLDYTIVTAPELKTEPELLHTETLSRHNPEGIRGAGEAGTIAVPAAIANAIEDALWAIGCEVAVNEIPVTPERLYELIRGAAGR